MTKLIGASEYIRCHCMGTGQSSYNVR